MSSKRQLRVKTFKLKVKVRLRLMVSDAQVCHIFVFNFVNALKVRVRHIPVMVKARGMHQANEGPYKYKYACVFV